MNPRKFNAQQLIYTKFACLQPPKAAQDRPLIAREEFQNCASHFTAMSRPNCSFDQLDDHFDNKYVAEEAEHHREG